MPPYSTAARYPHLLASGRQDQPFYQAMWNAVLQHGLWQGELNN